MGEFRVLRLFQLVGDCSFVGSKWRLQELAMMMMVVADGGGDGDGDPAFY